MELPKDRMNEEFWYYCKFCSKKTIFTMKHIHFKPDDNVQEGLVYENPETFIIATCEDCWYPSLFVEKDIISFDLTEIETSIERIYPPQKRKIDYLLPNIVRVSYDEAVNCEENHVWLASLAMVGRTLEAVMKEYYPSEKNFYNGLETMHKDGIISRELLDWSHELRKMRNISAHATDEKVTETDASEALDFLQVILDTIYKYRPKFERLKERREKEKDSKKSP